LLSPPVLTESMNEPLKNQSSDATELPAQPGLFVRRHIGPNAAEAREMLAPIGFKNLDELIAAAPTSTRPRPGQ
jgi:hypothetical protein